MSSSVALITGGSSGIGLALSELLLERGYLVCSVSRNPDRGINSERFIPLELDLGRLDRIAEFSRSYLEKFGVPDLLVNNAGNGAFFDWADFPYEQIHKQIDLLFAAPVLLCRAFAPEMEKRGNGTILNLSSLATLYPLPYFPLYNSGKSALSSFTQSMMIECDRFPKWIDFRMGDARTDFNRISAKRLESEQTEKMRNAWKKIESQLERSISPKSAAKQMIYAIDSGRSGTFFGGSAFHACILPMFRRILPERLLVPMIRLWYRMKI